MIFVFTQKSILIMHLLIMRKMKIIQPSEIFEFKYIFSLILFVFNINIFITVFHLGCYEGGGHTKVKGQEEREDCHDGVQL